jgi:molybdopterin synthase sulfur carrier subunit
MQVIIPTNLRPLTGGADTVDVAATDVAALIEALEAKHPGMKGRLLDDAGKLRRFVNIYVNGEDVRFLQDQATPLKETDEISIVPAIAGG